MFAVEYQPPFASLFSPFSSLDTPCGAAEPLTGVDRHNGIYGS